MLYIVPTPIGNLQDMTYRAVEILNTVALILAEDTRQSARLTQHYDIHTPMRSFHQHNEHKSLEGILSQLRDGISMALISDAGTPGISDPGFLLVRACVDAGIEIQTLPGATAFVPALVNSGIPCDTFVFIGFLPHQKGRQKKLRELVNETRTLVFYESPYRILRLLKEIAEIFGAERRVSLSREISKLHEETLRGTALEVYTALQNHSIKGEMVLVVQGC
jgi:16S rRNA (cytidine1402-2'-O)-methyltransferase